MVSSAVHSSGDCGSNPLPRNMLVTHKFLFVSKLFLVKDCVNDAVLFEKFLIRS